MTTARHFLSRTKPLHPIAIVVDAGRTGEWPFMTLRRDRGARTLAPNMSMERMAAVAAVGITQVGVSGKWVRRARAIGDYAGLAAIAATRSA